MFKEHLSLWTCACFRQCLSIVTYYRGLKRLIITWSPNSGVFRGILVLLPEK